MTCAALLLTALAQAALPDGGLDLLPNDSRLRLSSGAARWERVPVTGLQGVTEAVRLTTSSIPDVPWGIQISASLDGSVLTGDTLLLHLWVRGFSGRDEANSAYAVAYWQEAAAPNRKLVTAALAAGSEWRQIIVPVAVNLTLGPGQHNLSIHCGYRIQWLEFAGVRLINYGRLRTPESLPFTRLDYRGREADAPWRAAAAARIDRLRKAGLRVSVVDAEGAPVPEIETRIEMLRHEFRFGAAVTAQNLAQASADNDRYRAIVASHFNTVVFENDLKWAPWEVAKTNTHSTYRREWIDQALAWLDEHNIGIRGHYGVWGPLDEAGLGPGRELLDSLPSRLRAHLADKFPAIGPRVFEWDILNHPVGSWAPTLEQSFGPDLYAQLIAYGRQQAPPGVAFWINEGAVAEGGASAAAYERVIKDLRARGAPLDGIGFMGHFDAASLTDIDELYRVFDRFAALIPRLQFTEFDIDTRDEERQAEYLRDAMTIAFSHPNFDAIVMWGFWEGRHWRPNAALWRLDWSLKPVGEAWLDLVKKRWWTDETQTTGEDGRTEIRAFRGEYRVTAACPDGAVSDTLRLGAADAELVLTCPPGATPRAASRRKHP